jgi:uncharacterized protein YgiM (DUF1202 family)
MQKIFCIALICFFYLTTQSLAETVTVISRRANLRSGPGTKYKLVERLKKGESLDVLEKRGDWVRIRRKGGLNGWIYRSLLNVPSAKTLRANRKREISSKKAGCLETREPKGSQTKIQGGFLAKDVRLSESLGMVKVTGEMANYSPEDYFAVGFNINLYDAKDRPLGSGDIVVDEFPKGKTRPFTTYVEASYPRVHRYSIQFDFGI